MKDRFVLGLVAVLGLTCGALGASLLRSTPAEAQAARQWRYCFAADLHVADGDNAEHMRDGRGGIALAPGWVPIGGGNRGTAATVILCR